MARKSRREKYPDTPTFHYHNANPKGTITTDCVIRAISTATETPYPQTLRELTELALETGYHISDKKLYEKYLDRRGWKKNKQPKKTDGTKYTGSEFCQMLANNNQNYIAHIGGHHIVAIVDAKVYDHWNSTWGCIGNYWTLGAVKEIAVDTSLLEKKIKAAQTRQEFINLVPEVKAIKANNKAAFNMMADLLMYEFKQKGFRYTKSFSYDVIYNQDTRKFKL